MLKASPLTGSAMDPRWVEFGEVSPTMDETDVKEHHDAYIKKDGSIVFATKETRKEFCKQLDALFQSIAVNPYRPASWLLRAKCMLSLGYPELATGDAYKAWLLCQAYRNESHQYHKSASNGLEQEFKDRSNLTKILKPLYQELFSSLTSNKRIERLKRIEEQSLLMLGQALFFANSFSECEEMLKYLILRNGENHRYIVLAKATKAAYDDERNFHLVEKGLTRGEANIKQAVGSVFVKSYPWMDGYGPHRSSKLELDMKKEVGLHSKNICTIKEVESTSAMTNCRSVGVFATVDLPAGHTLFVETPIAAVVHDKPRQQQRCSFCFRCLAITDGNYRSVKCCSAQFCSRECEASALLTVHRCADASTPARSISLLEVPRGICDEPPLMHFHDLQQREVMAKLLVKCAKDFRALQISPIQNHSINAFSPFYHPNYASDFNFAKDIVEPTNLLNENGIDIFADKDFDTWVLRAVWARVRNNTWEDEESEGVNRTQWQGISPLMSMFNHSCNPNVRCDKQAGVAVQVATTIRAVPAGEQLFRSYIPLEELKLPYHQRYEKLYQWMEYCECKVCSDNRALEVKKESKAKRKAEAAGPTEAIRRRLTDPSMARKMTKAKKTRRLTTAVDRESRVSPGKGSNHARYSRPPKLPNPQASPGQLLATNEPSDSELKARFTYDLTGASDPEDEDYVDNPLDQDED